MKGYIIYNPDTREILGRYAGGGGTVEDIITVNNYPDGAVGHPVKLGIYESISDYKLGNKSPYTPVLAPNAAANILDRRAKAIANTELFKAVMAQIDSVRTEAGLPAKAAQQIMADIKRDLK